MSRITSFFASLLLIAAATPASMQQPTGLIPMQGTTGSGYLFSEPVGGSFVATIDTPKLKVTVSTTFASTSPWDKAGFELPEGILCGLNPPDLRELLDDAAVTFALGPDPKRSTSRRYPVKRSFRQGTQQVDGLPSQTTRFKVPPTGGKVIQIAVIAKDQTQLVFRKPASKRSKIIDVEGYWLDGRVELIVLDRHTVETECK